MHIAAQCGHAQVVSLLLARGAGVLDAVNADGTTPLHVAAHYGHTEVLTILLDSGAYLFLAFLLYSFFLGFISFLSSSRSLSYSFLFFSFTSK